MSYATDRRTATARSGEAAVTEELRAAGFSVKNLNDLVGNCPFADLLACRPATRVLVQVKATKTKKGLFGTRPGRVRALEVISTALDCRAIYAFVHFTGDDVVVRYERAAEVAVLAEADEAAYPGKNRFHVNIGLFDVTVDRISGLLTDPESLWTAALPCGEGDDVGGVCLVGELGDYCTECLDLLVAGGAGGFEFADAFTGFREL